jgi:hypothetical protein
VGKRERGGESLEAAVGGTESGGLEEWHGRIFFLSLNAKEDGLFYSEKMEFEETRETRKMM